VSEKSVRLRSDKQIALDYARAYAAYVDAQAHLSETKTAFVALLVERRLRGDSNKSLAAEFKLPAHLIHRSVMGSTEYQAAMDARRRAEEVADWRMDDMVNDFIVRQTAAHND
jgi:hypothetical protein